MTSPWTPLNTQGAQTTEDYFDPMRQQGHLLLIRIHAEAKYVVTKHCPDGWSRKEGREPFPNNALQVSVVDLNWQNPDNTLGKIFPEAMIHTGTLIGQLKRSIGETKLLMWKQKDHPQDRFGNPDKTNPYDVMDMSGNEQAVAAANNFLATHPEFMQIPAPAPYQAPAPPPQQAPPPPQQQYPQQGYGQQPGYGYPPPPPPQQPPWQSPQQYPPAQPGYGGPPPQQQPPWQQPAPQWQPAPQQQPAAWNTAAPPPEYYAQQGPPPQQQQPNTFYTAAQNHHGQPQPEQPPW